MTAHYTDDRVALHHGDALEVLQGLPDASVDSVVCDPPYGLEFMGREWDKFTDSAARFRSATDADAKTDGLTRGSMPDAYRAGRPFQLWCLEWATECLRVLKPGGHLLAFGGTRTWHRLACAVEDAGFEVRDSIAWLYGSGFPKSLAVDKAIDKLNGKPLDRLREFGAHVRAAREAARMTQAEVNRAMHMPQGCGWWEGKGAGVKWDLHLPSLATYTRLKALIGMDDTFDWLIEWAEAERAVVGKDRNWGTASHSTPNAPNGEWDITAPATPDAERWQGWGTALKPAFEPVVVARKPLAGTVAQTVLQYGTGALNVDACRVGDGEDRTSGGKAGAITDPLAYGVRGGGVERPTGGRWPTNVVLDDSQAAELDEQSGERTSGSRKEGTYRGLGYMGSDDSDYPAIEGDTGGASRFFPTFRYEAKAPATERPRVNGTAHPTVKPLDLMRWLVRLVTPPGGTVLEPFAGSGTTVEACIVEGFHCIAIEREADYLPLIMQRVNRRRDPVAYIKAAGDDMGLFDLEGLA